MGTHKIAMIKKTPFKIFSFNFFYRILEISATFMLIKILITTENKFYLQQTLQRFTRFSSSAKLIIFPIS